MTSTHTVTSEQKRAATDAVTQALHTLQAPSTTLFSSSSDGEIPAIKEANRQAAIPHLLRAITYLIPENQSDVPLRAAIEPWIRRS